MYMSALQPIVNREVLLLEMLMRMVSRLQLEAVLTLTPQAHLEGMSHVMKTVWSQGQRLLVRRVEPMGLGLRTALTSSV